MSKKKELLPKLRFPEFEDEEEWEEKKLIETTDKRVKWSFTGGPFGSNLKATDYTKEGIRIIQLQNIGDGEFNNDYKIYTSEEKANELLSCNIYSGEIILSKMGDPVGRACIIPDILKRCVMASDGIRLVVDEKRYSKYFIYSLINSIHIRTAIEKKATGSTRKRIGLDELKAVKLIVPQKLEQQKIASCLSSLDEVIAAQSQKLDLLKDHKKGLMQKLFPQEGEKVPKYRFKEFENDGEWVEKPIDKIKTIITDYVANGSFQSLRKNLNVLDSEDYAFYVRLTDLRAGLGHSNQKYVDKNTYLFLNKSSLFGGELLMANIGANVGEVWQMPFIEKPATLAPNMIMIKFKSDIDSQFIYQYLTSDIGVANISSVISGSGHPKINKTDLRQVNVFMPPKLEEQQKIAFCLSFLDALITSKTEKIKQLKLHKKGLMQGLFPKIND